MDNTSRTKIEEIEEIEEELEEENHEEEEENNNPHAFQNLPVAAQNLYNDFISVSFATFSGVTPGQGLVASNGLMFVFSDSNFIDFSENIIHIFINYESIIHVTVKFVGIDDVQFQPYAGPWGYKIKDAPIPTYEFNCHNDLRLYEMIKSLKKQ